MVEERPGGRPFDPWRRARSDQAKAFVADSVKRFREVEERRGLRRRRRTQTSEAALEAAVEALLCDVIHVRLTNPDKHVLVSRSKRYLGTASRYRSPVETERLPYIMDTLSGPYVGMLSMRVGRLGALTALRAGPSLEDHLPRAPFSFADFTSLDRGEVVILKGSKRHKNDVARLHEYEDTPETHAMRREMHVLNLWQARFDLQLLGMSEEKARRVDLSDRRQRRIFHNGRFDHGGRLYGGPHQTMSKCDRLLHLRINGERVVEADYGQMFVRLMYAMAEAPPPQGDLYRFPGLEAYRAGLKRVTLSLVFKEGDLKRLPEETPPALPPGMRAEEVQRTIAEAHPGIAHLFGGRVGFELFRWESDILLHALSLCRSGDCPALSIHDALIAPASMGRAAREALEAAYGARTGVEEMEGVVEVVDVASEVSSHSTPDSEDHLYPCEDLE